MIITATEALYTTRLHHALGEIVALHPVLVCGALGKTHERQFAELVFFLFPEILQFAAHVKAHRPVVILALHWIFLRLSLEMALNTSIVGLNEIGMRGIDDVGTRRARNMLASRPVAW